MEGNKLTSIVIPDTVTSIEKDAFALTKNLTKFKYLGTTAITENIFGDNKNVVVTVTDNYSSDSFARIKVKDDNKDGLSPGAIAGIVIAVLVVVAAVVIVVVLIIKKKKKSIEAATSDIY